MNLEQGQAWWLELLGWVLALIALTALAVGAPGVALVFGFGSVVAMLLSFVTWKGVHRD